VAQAPEHYLKLLIGDAFTTIAILRAELEAVTEQRDAARQALEAAGLPIPAAPAGRVMPFPAAAAPGTGP